MAWKPDPDNVDHYIGGTNFLFRELDDQEEDMFREYAREESPPSDTPMRILHPVCREEWEKRGIK